jgi:hypothetical protein
MKNLGDKIANNPIVHTIGRMTGCVDPITNQLKPESTCNKVRQDLNDGRYADAFYDRFWTKAANKRRQNNGR